MLSRIIQRYKNLSYKKKLIISFFMMALMLILIISLYSYTRVYGILHQEATGNTQQLISSLGYSVEYRLDEAHRLAKLAASSSEVQKIVTRSRENYNLEEQIHDYRDIVEYLNFLQQTNEVYRIRLFIPEGVIYARENSNILPLESVTQSDWYNDLMIDKPTFIFDAATTYYVWNNIQEVISCIIPIWHYDYQSLIGIISVDIQLSNITELLNVGALSSDSTILLLGEDGKLIAKSGLEISETLISNLADDKNDGKLIVADQGIKYFTYKYYISSTTWSLEYLLPADTVYSVSNRFRNELILLLGIVIILAFLFAIFGSKANTSRIIKLSQRMTEVQTGEFIVSENAYSKDEIGRLESSFNKLVGSLSELIEIQAKAKDQLRETELKLLQSQIQPHFLYNTLDLINWRVLRLGDRETSKIIQELSKFYKISLSYGQGMVPIRDEVEHARLYTNIQNNRFGGAITLVTSIEEEILDYIIPKITFQPLVENSIIHGLQEKPPKEGGTIWIEGMKKEECVVIEIRDNGQGMDADQLSSILDENKEHHYGVWNIHNRFQLAFGTEYGLSYQLNKPNGVRVFIRFPIIRALPHDNLFHPIKKDL